MWFQQNGASPRFRHDMRNQLLYIFPNRWTGKREHAEWPSRSPDLMRLSFSLWRYSKSKEYVLTTDTQFYLRYTTLGVEGYMERKIDILVLLVNANK